MHERIDRPFALDEMARIAYLSPFYFNRVFRQLTGLPPRRFHTALRIAAAKRLLLTTDLSVTEVCLEVGYQSLGTFTTHFHELVGVSPRELRRLASDPARAAAQVADAFASAKVDSVAPGLDTMAV
jgi:AraC family transcriptional regulator